MRTFSLQSKPPSNVSIHWLICIRHVMVHILSM